MIEGLQQLHSYIKAGNGYVARWCASPVSQVVHGNEMLEEFRQIQDPAPRFPRQIDHCNLSRYFRQVVL